MRTAILMLCLLCVLGGCAVTAGSGFTPPVPEGGTLYTQFSLRHEKDRYRTTNYRRGLLLPINSEVTLVSVDSRRIVVRVAGTGRPLTIENVPKHTAQTIGEAFAEILGTEPVDLSGFSDDERAAILGGSVEPGMSREAVLAALGPPPAVGTPNRASPEWVYWDTRWSKFRVFFDADGRVLSRGR